MNEDRIGPSGEIEPGTCPKCGLVEREWMGNGGIGYLLHGETYCCQPCAEDRKCICVKESAEVRAQKFYQSGATESK